jgi:hypothetical protein
VRERGSDGRKEMTSRPELSAGEIEKGIPVQSRPGGPWAGTRPGPKGSSRPFSPFFVLFLFFLF